MWIRIYNWSSMRFLAKKRSFARQSQELTGYGIGIVIQIFFTSLLLWRRFNRILSIKDSKGKWVTGLMIWFWFKTSFSTFLISFPKKNIFYYEYNPLPRWRKIIIHWGNSIVLPRQEVLRQRDPLISIYLYCAWNILPYWWVNSESYVEGYSSRKGSIIFTLIFFVDDLILMVEATIDNCVFIQSVPNSFCEASGQKKHFGKIYHLFFQIHSFKGKKSFSEILKFRTWITLVLTWAFRLIIQMLKWVSSTLLLIRLEPSWQVGDPAFFPWHVEFPLWILLCQPVISQFLDPMIGDGFGNPRNSLSSLCHMARL